MFSVLMTAVGAPKDVIKLHIDLAAKAGKRARKSAWRAGARRTALRHTEFFPALEAWTESFEIQPLELD